MRKRGKKDHVRSNLFSSSTASFLLGLLAPNCRLSPRQNHLYTDSSQRWSVNNIFEASLRYIPTSKANSSCFHQLAGAWALDICDLTCYSKEMELLRSSDIGFLVNLRQSYQPISVTMMNLDNEVKKNSLQSFGLNATITLQTILQVAKIGFIEKHIKTTDCQTTCREIERQQCDVERPAFSCYIQVNHTNLLSLVFSVKKSNLKCQLFTIISILLILD